MKDYFYGENASDFVPAESNPHRVRITPPLIVLLAFLLGGCAAPEQVPVCNKYSYTPVQMNGEPGVFLDGEDIENLHSLILGLAQGKCRLPSSGQDA